MQFSIFQVSRKAGRKRNEDRMGYAFTRDAAMLVVADGMGGHPMGDVAAQRTLEVFAGEFQKHALPIVVDPLPFLQRTALLAHQTLLSIGVELQLNEAPRTTVVVALMQQGQICWMHCGDSRLYWVRGGKLLARTLDHTQAERMYKLSEDSRAAMRHVLFTCLGSQQDPLLDFSPMQNLRSGDKVLLCSDGLWGVMTQEELLETLSAHKVGKAVPDLVDLALAKTGGRGDNATALAIEWEVPDPVTDDAAISTHEVSQDNFFVSSLATVPQEVDFEDMSDDAIERSIAEINAAIRASAIRRPS